MGRSTLQWLAPELARAGLIRNEEWIEAHAARATALFPNQGMWTASTLLAALHPRAIEYLEQAPVLALAATHGAVLEKKQARTYAAMNWGPLVERGVKLKDMMAAFRVAYPMRALSGNAIRPAIWPAIMAMTQHVDTSTIAQSIPEEPRRHMHWLGDIDRLWETLERRGAEGRGELLGWAMLAISRAKPVADYPVSPGHIADFLICHRNEFNTRWTWERVVRETQQWNETLANADIDRVSDAHREYDVEVDYAPLPKQFSARGHDFTALQSLRALIIEGKAMHHCVASYYRDIKSRFTRIYSISKDGQRLATVEFRQVRADVWRVAQVKGFANARPSGIVQKAAEEFTTVVNKALSTGGWKPPRSVPLSSGPRHAL